ncbi:MAG: hypothetical protein ABIG95_02525 [Candidatus Woesearchaeota archaeon]
MALLGAFIDERTLVSVTSNSSASFAHGLPASPDWVHIRETTSSASSVSAVEITPLWDATNVSLYNAGERNSTVVEVQSVVYHSLIR